MNWGQVLGLVRDMNTEGDKSVGTTPPPFSLEFNQGRSGLVTRVGHEEVEPPLISVSPESGEPGLSGPDEEKGKDDLECDILNENDSYHLQVEEKPSSCVQEVGQERVVNVDQGDQEQGLIQSDHIVILSRNGQSPLFPMHSNRHHENKH